MTVAALIGAARAVLAADPCRIEVVEAGSGWPVPLVELRTTHYVRLLTDNAGVIALDLPELMGREVWFDVFGHGYEVKKDGFGYRGVRLTPESGRTLRVEVARTIECGLCVWNDATSNFERLRVLWTRTETAPKKPLAPEGHPAFWKDDQGRRWVLFGNPLPRLRCPATFEAWQDAATWEALDPQQTLEPASGGKPVKPHYADPLPAGLGRPGADPSTRMKWGGVRGCSTGTGRLRP